MTTKAAFSEQEWELVRSAPPMAGMIVAMADEGGMLRETVAIAKAYPEARKQHGKSELLDEIVSTRPARDHTHFRSYDELKRHGVQTLRDAVSTLEGKATQEEVDDYRRFVLTLARHAAERHREHGRQISPAEQEALDDVADVLGKGAA